MSNYFKKNQSNYYKSIKYVDALLLGFLRNSFPLKCEGEYSLTLMEKEFRRLFHKSLILNKKTKMSWIIAPLSLIPLTLISHLT